MLDSLEEFVTVGSLFVLSALDITTNAITIMIPAKTLCFENQFVLAVSFFHFAPPMKLIILLLQGLKLKVTATLDCLGPK